jgi:hypothetical protein
VTPTLDASGQTVCDSTGGATSNSLSGHALRSYLSDTHPEHSDRDSGKLSFGGVLSFTVDYNSCLTGNLFSIPEGDDNNAFCGYRAMYNERQEQHREAKDLVYELLATQVQQPGVSPEDVRDSTTAAVAAKVGEKVASAAVRAVYTHELQYVHVDSVSTAVRLAQHAAAERVEIFLAEYARWSHARAAVCSCARVA